MHGRPCGQHGSPAHHVAGTPDCILLGAPTITRLGVYHALLCALPHIRTSCCPCCLQVVFKPLYTEQLLPRSASPGDQPTNGGSSGSRDAVTAEDIMGLLEQGLFLHEHGLESAIGGKASEATVLLAGIPGDIASTVAKELTFKGVAWDRLLFCDYF